MTVMYHNHSDVSELLCVVYQNGYTIERHNDVSGWFQCHVTMVKAVNIRMVSQGTADISQGKHPSAAVE